MARRVLAAIRDDELYVFTHPVMRGVVEERFRAILTAFFQGHVGNEPSILFNGVEHRQKGQEPKRGVINICYFIRIGGGGATQHETHCGRLLP